MHGPLNVKFKNEYLLNNRIFFCLDCTFKNCPGQFAKLYSLYVDFGSTSHGKYIYTVLLALLPDKM